MRHVRASYQVISDEREVPGHIRRLAARTVIFDIEPLVAAWDSTQEALDCGIARVLDEVRTVPSLSVVCFATNSARAPSAIPVVEGIRVDYEASARKPIRTAPYHCLPRPGLLIGDQVATDGLLAHRIGYTFVHFRPPPGSMPPGPALLSGWGDLMRPLLFSRKRGRWPAHSGPPGAR
jgi:predicted HAD superfamily phosphohydrolase YqeG